MTLTNQTDSNTVLITGGCGFVGANLVKYLLEQGNYKIKILDDLSTGCREYIDHILSSLKPKNPMNSINKIELLSGDIRDQEKVEKATEGINAIVHLAAITGVPDSIDNPISTYEINVMGTQNLLEVCRKKTIEKFVFASSNAAVGEKEPPIHEEMVPEPISPYGASKLAGEGLCSAYSHSFGIKANVLRFANVYGPFSDHKGSVVAKFIKNVLNDRPLVIYGDGNQTRDFIHARDIAKAIKLTLESECSGEVFQIGTGEENTILELAGMIQKLAKENGYESPKIIHKDPRKGDIYRNYTDLSKARKKLGFKPEVHIKEGLREVWESGMCII